MSVPSPSPYRINFSFYFSVQYIHVKRLFKTVPIFFPNFSAVFEKLANTSQQELSFNRILKESFKKIRKKADTVFISVYSSCNAENFKAILLCVRDL